MYKCVIFFTLITITISCKSKNSKIETYSYSHERDSIKIAINAKRDSIKEIEGLKVIGGLYWGMSYNDFIPAFDSLSQNHKDIGTFKIKSHYHSNSIIFIEENSLKEIPISVGNTAVFYRDSLVFLSLSHEESIINFRKESYPLEKILKDIIDLYSEKYGEPDFLERNIRWSLLDRCINLRGTKILSIASWDISYKCIRLYVVTENGFTACPILQFFYKSKIDSINNLINKRINDMEMKDRHQKMIQDSINQKMIQDSINIEKAKSII